MIMNIIVGMHMRSVDNKKRRSQIPIEMTYQGQIE